MRPNAGIRKGNARGTALAQADFGCNALVDLLWAWRVAGTRMPSVGDGCSACGIYRARRRNVENQRKIAAAVESGARRLVHRTPITKLLALAWKQLGLSRAVMGPDGHVDKAGPGLYSICDTALVRSCQVIENTNIRVTVTSSF